MRWGAIWRHHPLPVIHVLGSLVPCLYMCNMSVCYHQAPIWQLSTSNSHLHQYNSKSQLVARGTLLTRFEHRGWLFKSPRILVTYPVGWPPKNVRVWKTLINIISLFGAKYPSTCRAGVWPLSSATKISVDPSPASFNANINNSTLCHLLSSCPAGGAGYGLCPLLWQLICPWATVLREGSWLNLWVAVWWDTRW